MAKCEYCTSEYHLDDLGRIIEYKVDLEIFGERRKFYISNIEIEQIYGEAYRNLAGKLITSLPIKQEYKITLISY